MRGSWQSHLHICALKTLKETLTQAEIPKDRWMFYLRFFCWINHITLLLSMSSTLCFFVQSFQFIFISSHCIFPLLSFTYIFTLSSHFFIFVFQFPLPFCFYLVLPSSLILSIRSKKIFDITGCRVDYEKLEISNGALLL